MTSTTESETVESSSERSFPLRRVALFAAIAVAAIAVLSAALLLGLRLARPGVLPGVVVADVAVGGMSADELRAALAAMEQRAAASTVAVQRGEVSATATNAQLGYAMDVDSTADEVLWRGRQGNPIAALADHLRAFRGTTEVPLIETIDLKSITAWVDEIAPELRLEPVEGDLQFAGAAVTRIDPQDGAEVAVDDLALMVRDAVVSNGSEILEAPTVAIPAVTTTGDVDAVYSLAQRAVSDSFTLTRSDGSITLSTEQIGGLLSVERDAGDGPGLHLTADAAALSRLIPAEVINGFESEPVDARFEVSGGTVSIVEAIDGFRFDSDIAAAQLVEVVTAEGPREAEIAGELLEPELTTAAAEALEIVEQVSEFTTNHACCQSRVTNIQRIADMVDGVVIRPGETFSVNGHVGERTREKGFVGGGAIFEGEFVEQIGGGVSQFATTMFNAAYFGGYKLTEYKAHSYYISRYPVGREATLNYPNVDLKVTNNSPYGILIKTSYTGSSITVTFYGKKWVEVESITGNAHNHRPTPTKHRENPALPPGTERVVSGGGYQGFDIVVTRVLRFPDGREEREDYFTRYLSEPRIIERNSSPAPPPEPDPTPEPDPEPSPDPEPDGGQPDSE